MKLLVYILSLLTPLITNLALAQLPERPTDPRHPSSDSYSYTVKHETLKVDGRVIDLFLPLEIKDKTQKAPIVVFGHGQAIGVEGYDQTFIHLARKGVMVIHPTYDTGFFDQNWRRMADDFNKLTASALEKYAAYGDRKSIIYSGHSKGGYIALIAAGAPSLRANGIQVNSLLLFSPAGYDAEYIKTLDPEAPLTLAWGEQDNVIKQESISEIYSRSPSKFKQSIVVKSYSSLKADHFYILNKSYIFGGQAGVSPFHYYSAWKWLMGAAWDSQGGQKAMNPYLYGEEASSTGAANLKHTISRSW